MPNGRPNIVLITSDQQRGDVYGFMGRNVQTPNIDSLARRGTRFPNMITPNLVCQPARASIATGLLPLTHGLWDNGLDLDDAVAARGFAPRLESLGGYSTALIGKAHFVARLPYEPTGTPEDRKSPHDPDWTGPYKGFQYVELTLSGDIDQAPYPPPYGQHYERWLYAQQGSPEIAAAYAQRIVPDPHPAQTWHSQAPVEWHVSTWCAERTIAYLREHARSDHPFLIWMSFPDPHHPFDCPEPWSRLHDPKDVDLPPHRSLDLERRPWWHRASLERQPQGKDDYSRMLRSKFTRIASQSDEQLAHLIANYYGMVALIDHSVGLVEQELARLGLSDDTYLFYTSDHGDWLGDHGLLLKGPMPYESLLRVNGILVGPNVPAGRVVQDPVSTLDLAATFADIAGVEPDPSWHSRSLMNLVVGSPSAHREHAYSEWDLDAARCGVGLRLRTVRTADHKLTVELDSRMGELYDLSEDPDEMHNLFDDRAYASLRADLEGLIHDRPNDAVAHREPLIGPG